MKKILIISQTRQGKFVYGGPIYRNSIIKLLKKNFKKLYVDEIFAAKECNKLVKILLQVNAVVSSIFLRFPSKVVYFRSQVFKKNLQYLILRNNYDIIFVDGALMLWCVDLIPENSFIILISHNVEHELYKQQISNYRRIPLLGRILENDGEKLKDFELKYITKVKKIITVSSDDEKYFRSKDDQLEISTIPPSFDYNVDRRPDKSSSKEVKLGFLGNMEWWPNKKSLKWFIEEILPFIPDQFELHVYGRGSERYSGNKIVNHGFVQDISNVWKNVDIMIQPIICGSGVNIKVAEAIFNRMPVIATPMAMRGLILHYDEAIKILETSGEWINYINSEEIYKLKMQASEYNSNFFSLETNFKKIKKFLEI